MTRFSCPFLDGEVELTDERRSHIERHHPEITNGLDALIEAVLSQPDEVRRDMRQEETRLISTFFPLFLRGKHMVVVVVSDAPAAPGDSQRHWIVTAYPARELTQGVTEWKAG